MKIFNCRYNTEKETIRAILGLQSISSHAKSLKISFFLRLKEKNVPSSILLNELYKRKDISSIQTEVNSILSASDSKNWQTTLSKQIPVVKKLLKNKDKTETMNKIESSNSKQMWIARKIINKNKTTTLEILNSLNLTSRVQMWFQTVTNNNFATPFKFENAQVCRLCKAKNCEITHLALCCEKLANTRIQLLTDTLKDLKKNDKIDDLQREILTKILEQKISQTKVQEMTLRNKRSKRFSNCAINANFLNDVLDFQNKHDEITEVDENLMVELLGAGSFRNITTTKRFIDYLITIQESYIKLQYIPKHQKRRKRNVERDPMEIESSDSD